jgi:hypothetical protein
MRFFYLMERISVHRNAFEIYKCCSIIYLEGNVLCNSEQIIGLTQIENSVYGK